ncbi:hypothetical protein Tco_1196020, partial [Tanacetum coccineum]
MNMGLDRHMQMVRGNGGNQFRQYARQNAGNQIEYNAGQLAGNQIVYNVVQNAWNQVGHNAVQNLGIQNARNQNGLIVVLGIANQNENGNVVAAQAKGNGNGNNANQIRCYNYRGLSHYARNCTEEAWIQLHAEEFDLMVAAADYEKIEEVNANCILMANLQQTSPSNTLTDKALVYDSNGSDE